METMERTTWVCDNCTRPNAGVRKRCEECGIPAMGLWAQIPHYLVTPPGTLPYPAGSLALIEALGRVGNLSLPVGDLPSQAAATRARSPGWRKSAASA